MYCWYNLGKKSKKTGEQLLSNSIKGTKTLEEYSEMQNNVSSIGFVI